MQNRHWILPLWLACSVFAGGSGCEHASDRSEPDPTETLEDAKPPPLATLAQVDAALVDKVTAKAFVLVTGAKVRVGTMPLVGLRATGGELRLEGTPPGDEVSVEKLGPALKTILGAGGRGVRGGLAGAEGASFGGAGRGFGQPRDATAQAAPRKRPKRVKRKRHKPIKIDPKSMDAIANALGALEVRPMVLVVADAETPMGRIAEVVRTVANATLIMGCPSLAAARGDKLVAVHIDRCDPRRNPSPHPRLVAGTAMTSEETSAAVAALYVAPKPPAFGSLAASPKLFLAAKADVSIEHYLTIAAAARHAIATSQEATFGGMTLTLAATP